MLAANDAACLPFYHLSHYFDAASLSEDIFHFYAARHVIQGHSHESHIRLNPEYGRNSALQKIRNGSPDQKPSSAGEEIEEINEAAAQ